MRPFRLIVWSLNWIVAIVVGFLGILAYLDAPVNMWLAIFEDEAGLVWFILGLILVLLDLTYFVVAQIYGYTMYTHIPVKTADSSMTVSVQALRDTLIHTLKREPEVHSVNVELKLDRSRTHVALVRAFGTIWDGPDILQTTMKMQQVLRRRFSEIVDPDEDPKFEVQLDSFRFVGKRKGFRERIDRIKHTFRGPQYPIGGC